MQSAQTEMMEGISFENLPQTWHRRTWFASTSRPFPLLSPYLSPTSYHNICPSIPEFGRLAKPELTPFPAYAIIPSN
jgi:hypothetical protein